MSDWYYSQDDQQKGPVPLEELQRMIAEGTLNANRDLVWQTGMKDWLPAAQVPELTLGSAPAAPAGGMSGGDLARSYPPMAPMADVEWEDVPPGSVTIDVGACISRGFELTKRHLGVICLAGLVYLGIEVGMGIVIGIVDVVLGIPQDGGIAFDPASGNFNTTAANSPALAARLVSLFLNIVSNVVSIFLSMGIIRIGLNLVSGRRAEVGMLFGEGSKLLRSVGGGIIYGLMVAVGLLFLIVPGIYLAMRFGQYQNAIVDRDLGVMDAFSYSSDITTNNRMSLFGLAVLNFLIILAGVLAFCVGVFFAYPIVVLAGLVSYRWMQHGPVVLQDRTV